MGFFNIYLEMKCYYCPASDSINIKSIILEHLFINISFLRDLIFSPIALVRTSSPKLSCGNRLHAGVFKSVE